MPNKLIWLPTVLKESGLKVALVDGWEYRGRGDVGDVCGVICHHTAGPKQGNMPSLRTLIDGRSDLPGPLSQLGLGRDGTFYVIAAGRCNHAGEGIWQKVTAGNSRFIGIEAENAGTASDPWPQVQMDAYERGVAAILKHIGRGAEFCAGHKEYALPAGRKPDPSFDMGIFRHHVAAILEGTAPAPVLIQPAEPPAAGGGTAGRPTLRRGAGKEQADLVRQVQKKLKLDDDGDFGPKTEAAVREFQRVHGLVPDGIVGPKTWLALDAAV
jgi:hypothetical protein